MLQSLHQAAQYLATAGISFLDKRDDDSHTNLGWNSERAALDTWPLNDTGIKLSLNFRQFSLAWIQEDGTTGAELDLTGQSHQAVIDWIGSTAKNAGLSREYHFSLHYELPYPAIRAEDQHPSGSDQHQVEALIEGYSTAQNRLEQLLQEFDLSSTIRVWSHHFDLGAYATILPEQGIAVGIGYAIPDTMIEEHYYYLSPWKGHDSQSTAGMPALSSGEWMDGGFKGAILRSGGVSETHIGQFLSEAIQAMKSHFA